jgi:hypothetical protein
MVIEPGPAHPFPSLGHTALARFLHVAPQAVLRWLEMGLAADSHGRIDPFAAVNWLSAGHLGECPVMARRWRRYIGWFAPFIAGRDRRRTVRWRRCHRLYLPEAAGAVSWFLPAPEESATQHCRSQEGIDADGLRTSACRGGVQLHGQPVEAAVTARGSVVLEIAPNLVLAPGDADFPVLHALMLEVIEAFSYAYRHHRPFEYPQARTGGAVTPQWTGSCIDCAMALGALLHVRGRPWRLRAGLVAHSAIANPHVWIEAETTKGWAPLDPTIPAIVRMLGPEYGDWRDVARQYTGRCDARRVQIASGGDAAEIPGGPTLDAVGGEIAVRRSDGSWANAFPCQDWVCGECEAVFETV